MLVSPTSTLPSTFRGERARARALRGSPRARAPGDASLPGAGPLPPEDLARLRGALRASLGADAELLQDAPGESLRRTSVGLVLRSISIRYRKGMKDEEE